MARVKVAVLISGRGSNLQALIEASAAADYPAEIVLVLSNRADAGGLAYARDAGIRHAVIDHRGFADRDSYDTALEAAIVEAGAELICLAGFMRLLGRAFSLRWQDRILNIHPSLLPAFRGLNTHERVLASGVRFTGCTVHFVRPEMDDGPIIIQGVVPVRPDDDPGRLAARVLSVEHRIFPLALAWAAGGRLSVSDNRVTVAGGMAPEVMPINPAA